MEANNLKPEIKQYSIVLIGEFNPAMFSPEWFGKNNVIAKEDVDFAKREKSNSIVSSAVTFFDTNQLSVRIENKRFFVETRKEPLTVMKDFITKTFSDLSNYTINAYGLNYGAHYKLDSIDIYHGVGDKLAPKKYWASLLGEDVSGNERNGGLASITMLEHKKPKESGQLSLTLSTSALLTSFDNKEYGLFLACNDHTVLSKENATADVLIEKLENEFDSSFEKMKKIQTSLLSEVLDELKKE